MAANPRIALEDVEAKVYEDFAQYWDLVKFKVILMKDPVHKQTLHTAKKLETEDDFDDHEDIYAV